MNTEQILTPEELYEKSEQLQLENKLEVREGSEVILEVSTKKGIVFPAGRTNAVISINENGIIGFSNRLSFTAMFLVSEYNKLYKEYVQLQKKLNELDE